jgi:hypothetical protein
MVTESTGRLMMVIASISPEPSSTAPARWRAEIITRKARIFFIFDAPSLSETYTPPYYIMLFHPEIGCRLPPIIFLMIFPTTHAP